MIATPTVAYWFKDSQGWTLHHVPESWLVKHIYDGKEEWMRTGWLEGIDPLAVPSRQMFQLHRADFFEPPAGEPRRTE